METFVEVKVVGLAPHDELQNIKGSNWATFPGGREYVTYCYLESLPQVASEKATELEAEIRSEPVRIDNER